MSEGARARSKGTGLRPVGPYVRNFYFRLNLICVMLLKQSLLHVMPKRILMASFIVGDSGSPLYQILSSGDEALLFGHFIAYVRESPYTYVASFAGRENYLGVTPVTGE